LSVFCVLSLCLLPQWAFSGKASLPAPEATALAQIRLGDETNLAGLAAFSAQLSSPLQVYTRFYPAQGQVDLVIAADRELQQKLSGRGYTVQILDPDMQGASYYLLSGTPAALKHGQRLTRVLLTVGRHAIARVEKGEEQALAEAGLRLKRLAPQPLATPRQASALPTLPAAVTPNPLVQEMIGKVNSTTLYNLVGYLSGATPATIGGAAYTIATRNTNTVIPINQATQYVYEYMQAAGFSPSYHSYSYGGGSKRNVIAEQAGVTQPNNIYLLMAHVDDTSGSSMTNAPGADDNASGTAAVMHIASILRQYNFGCTLRYALVTGEEQGLYGSAAYAEEVAGNGDNLLGVLNLDMLGYNTAGSAPDLELDWKDTNDQALANLFVNAVSAYSLQLEPYLYRSASDDSDHASFWDNYPAILAIEDWDDHTPFYHQTGDTRGTLNMSYYTEFVKAALATFAHMGCQPVVVTTMLSGSVVDQTSGAALSGAAVEAWQGSSKKGSTTTASNGGYSMALPAGSYTVNVSATDHRTTTYSNVAITTGQTTRQDASLTSCITIKGTALRVSTNTPGISQTVSFTASVSAGVTPITYAWNFGDGGGASGASVTHAYSVKGAFPLTLTTNNSCLAAQTAATTLYVGLKYVFLPMGMKNAAP